MIEQVLEEIPEEYLEKFQRFLAEKPIPRNVLRTSLEDYLDTVRKVAALVPNFRVLTLEKLANACLVLIEDAGDQAEKRRLAQAAVRYLMEEEEDDEITGVLALDDDRQIVNAVARAFGRTDLVVAV